jgi:hypothetical protein
MAFPEVLRVEYEKAARQVACEAFQLACCMACDQEFSTFLWGQECPCHHVGPELTGLKAIFDV